MSTRDAASGISTRAWVLAGVYSAVVLGAGIWVTVATGQWFVLLLAIGLTAPVEVLLLSRHRRRGVSIRPPASKRN
ncbi:hypothetical protein IWX78_001297 [Mycetocola sp. CAN_C7]|uniref:hypothetical protein n=1 Tax=Mycetocola sp. CAN_C7 TaxID=2787724 RepID=UPI0018CB8789